MNSRASKNLIYSKGSSQSRMPESGRGWGEPSDVAPELSPTEKYNKASKSQEESSGMLRRNKGDFSKRSNYA